MSKTTTGGAQAVKACARCGKRLPHQDRRLFSTWTRSYYCVDIDACGRRARRNHHTKET